MLKLKPPVRNAQGHCGGQTAVEMNVKNSCICRPGKTECPLTDTVKIVFAQLTSGRGPDLKIRFPFFFFFQNPFAFDQIRAIFHKTAF